MIIEINQNEVESLLNNVRVVFDDSTVDLESLGIYMGDDGVYSTTLDHYLMIKRQLSDAENSI